MIETFSSWMKTYQRSYSSNDEMMKRFEIFQQNWQIIQSHNPSVGYSLGLNQFADLTTEEFRSIYLKNPISPSARSVHSTNKKSRQPMGKQGGIDWSKKGVCPPVQNQGNSGLVLPMVAVENVECMNGINQCDQIPLSQQQIIDCAQMNSFDQIYAGIISKGGLDSEAAYPYTGEQGTCKFDLTEVGAVVSSYTDVTRGDETDMASDLATYGPISVGVDASGFQFYTSGIFTGPCSSTNLDHAMLLVGYGTQGGTGYWIGQNTWGTAWGMNGFIWVIRNGSNACGIATAATFPIIDDCP